MTREQLAHVLRAAARIAQDPDVVVIGSQSILGSFPEDGLPVAVSASIEVDVAFLDDPQDEKGDAVDGAIGERRRLTRESCNASDQQPRRRTVCWHELILSGSPRGVGDGADLRLRQDFIRVTIKGKIWSQFWSQFGVVRP
jgi:hypothetical protein